MLDPETGQEVADPATPDGGAAAGAGGGEGGEELPAGAEEPFLPINERTVYKTREDAVKGYQNLQERLTTYSRFGDPEALAERLARADAIAAAAAPKPAQDKSKWTPEQRRAHAEWLEQAKSEFGLMTQEDFQRAQHEQIAEKANGDAIAFLQEHKIDLGGQKDIERFVNFGCAMVNTDPELNALYFSGRTREVMELIAPLYGPIAAQLKSKEPPANGAGAQPNAARAAAANYQAVKDKTKALPVSPPKGGAAGVKPPEKPNYKDVGARKARAMAILEERGVGG